MLTALSFAAALLGLAALALSMDRHHDLLLRRQRQHGAHPRQAGWRRLALRAIGAAALAGALVCACAGIGAAQGLLLWLGLLSAAALMVAAALALWPHPK